jgi:hypothetical protein
LHWYFDGKQVSNSSLTATNINYFGRGFDAPSVFDENLGTYMYSGTEKNIIIFTYPTQINMNQYNFETAVNNISRDPVSWRLLYSTGNTNFILLDQQINFPTRPIRGEYMPIIQISFS